jgi:steroid delta-isomerase-like uncharacterized protein
MTHDEVVSFLGKRQDAYARHDAAALAADHTPDGIVNSPMFAQIQGRPDIEAAYRALFASFSDWSIVLDVPIVDGDRAAQPFSVSATHTGDFMGLPGSGRRFRLHGALIFRMRDGLIAEERRVYDFTALLIQLGILRGKLAK